MTEDRFVRPPLRITLKSISIFFNPDSIILEQELDMCIALIRSHIERLKKLKEENK